MGRKKYEAVRSSINMDSELKKAYKMFEKIEDDRAPNVVYNLPDIFMSGLAMFSLKYSSLLDFDEQTNLERENLKSVYGIEGVCSDTHLRRVLDSHKSEPIRACFSNRFGDLQRTGLLKEYEYKIGSIPYLIVSCDGVQHFSSKRISCPCCLERKHRNGSITYHHNMLCAALVHPEKREVFMMDTEAIIQQDGTTKNDCELNAAKRLFSHMESDYEDFSEQYNFLVVEDALYANVPHLRKLQQMNYSFIVNVKPDSHKSLFAHIEGRRLRNQTQKRSIKKDGFTHRFEWVNNIPLNNTDQEFRINFLYYEQIDPKGKKTTFTWVTDIALRANRVWSVMKAGRARWKIENETFNTLKNLGYHFEHNYGHGKDHLCTTLAHLMFLAFYIDQFVQACSKTFQQLERNIRTKIKLWNTVKAVFQTIPCKSMDFIYRQIAKLFSIQLE